MILKIFGIIPIIKYTLKLLKPSDFKKIKNFSCRNHFEKSSVLFLVIETINMPKTIIFFAKLSLIIIVTVSLTS